MNLTTSWSSFKIYAHVRWSFRPFSLSRRGWKPRRRFSTRTNPAAPPAGDNLFSVIDLVSSPTTDIGTGSIIDSHVDPATQIGYFCVLTAAHNFPGSTAIGFGDFGTRRTAPIRSPRRTQ